MKTRKLSEEVWHDADSKVYRLSSVVNTLNMVLMRWGGARRAAGLKRYCDSGRQGELYPRD